MAFRARISSRHGSHPGFNVGVHLNPRWILSGVNRETVFRTVPPRHGVSTGIDLSGAVTAGSSLWRRAFLRGDSSVTLCFEGDDHMAVQIAPATCEEVSSGHAVSATRMYCDRIGAVKKALSGLTAGEFKSTWYVKELDALLAKTKASPSRSPSAPPNCPVEAVVQGGRPHPLDDPDQALHNPTPLKKRGRTKHRHKGPMDIKRKRKTAKDPS